MSEKKKKKKNQQRKEERKIFLADDPNQKAHTKNDGSNVPAPKKGKNIGRHRERTQKNP